jgi:hypothetical protein
MASTIDVNVPALQERVTKLLKDPKAEWPVIAAEQTTVEQLYKGYIGPLAAIPAIAGFIGGSIIGYSAPFIGTYRVPFVRGFFWMIVTFALMLIGVYVSAFIINKLAPTFDSTPSEIQALKLTGYAATPSFLGGIFSIIPMLGWLGIFPALYGVYLFYLGLPVMMKTPETKVIPYMLVAAIVSMLVMFILFAIAGAFLGMGMILS